MTRQTTRPSREMDFSLLSPCSVVAMLCGCRLVREISVW
jgi:hypothetical protein